MQSAAINAMNLENAVLTVSLLVARTESIATMPADIAKSSFKMVARIMAISDAKNILSQEVIFILLIKVMYVL